MNINHAEIPLLNNASPPRKFKKKGAWKIKERFLIAKVNPYPTIPPQVDTSTVFKTMFGEARYLVEKDHFAQGAISKIYRGWDRHLELDVAIKVLHPAWSFVDDLRDAIELEAKTIAKISHPGIPKVYNFIIADTLKERETPIMVMELIKGESLFERIKNKKHKPLKIEKILKIISQVADTLDYIHNFGQDKPEPIKRLVHCDIKPSNIILSSPHAKIIDFGGSTWAYKKGIVVDGYSSPESYNNVNDNRSDEFSLACVAYCCLFGQQPPVKGFFVDTNSITIKSFNSKEFRYKLSDLNRQRLFDLFQKALHYNPNRRYQTCTEFAQTFSWILSNPE